MKTVILAISTGVCAWMWLKSNIAVKALALYMIENGCPEPTSEEADKYVMKVARKIFSGKM